MAAWWTTGNSTSPWRRYRIAILVRKLLLELIKVDLAYRHRAGGQFERFGLEGYIARFPDLGCVADLPLDVVIAEYRIRHRWGDKPDHDEYVRRFSSLSAELPDALTKVDRELASETKPGSDSSALLAIGRQVGDYRIVREVGRGGMGVVYEAQQISLDRRVALKILPTSAVLDSRQLQRFKNEAQAAALLHHPNIVPIYGVGSERGVHFFFDALC